jgi:hypothetical protein
VKLVFKRSAVEAALPSFLGMGINAQEGSLENPVWDGFFVLSNGENAEKIPKWAFFELAELAGKQFLKSGLFPIAAYFRPTMVQRKKAA